MTSSRPTARKRFYTAVTVATQPEGFTIMLDARSIKTPAGQSLMVPTKGLADAIAGEWARQGETLNLTDLAFTKLANTSLDGVVNAKHDVIQDIVRYAASDLICYRAEAPAALAELQAKTWDPILSWVVREYEAKFVTTQQVRHVKQPDIALDRVREQVADLNPWQLASFHTVTVILGSALLALALRSRRLTTDEAWAAAHVDETWQNGRWGQDYEAVLRNERRLAEFEAAFAFGTMASQNG